MKNLINIILILSIPTWIFSGVTNSIINIWEESTNLSESINTISFIIVSVLGITNYLIYSDKKNIFKVNKTKKPKIGGCSSCKKRKK